MLAAAFTVTLKLVHDQQETKKVKEDGGGTTILWPYGWRVADTQAGQPGGARAGEMVGALGSE